MKGAAYGALAALLTLGAVAWWIGSRPEQPGDTVEPLAAGPAGSPPEVAAPSDPRAASAPEPEQRRSATADGPRAPLVSEPDASGVLELEVVWSAHSIPAYGIGVRAYLEGSVAPHALVREARSDSRGIARFERLPAGGVRVRGDRSGELRVELPAGQTVRERLVLDDGFRLRGRTIDAAGRTVGNAQLYLQRPGERDAQLVCEADATGAFELPGAVSGQLLFARARDNSPSLPWRIEAPANANSEVKLALGQRGALLIGQVLDGAETALVGAAVCLEPLSGAGDAPYATTLTDGEGRFALLGLDPAPARLMVLFPGLAPYESAVTLTPGGRNEQLVRLAAGGVVTGRVRYEDGRPARAVTLRVGQRDDWLRLECRTHEDGSYVLRGAPPGKIKLSVGVTSYVVDVPREGSVEWNGIVREADARR